MGMTNEEVNQIVASDQHHSYHQVDALASDMNQLRRANQLELPNLRQAILAPQALAARTMVWHPLSPYALCKLVGIQAFSGPSRVGWTILSCDTVWQPAVPVPSGHLTVRYLNTTRCCEPGVRQARPLALDNDRERTSIVAAPTLNTVRQTRCVPK
ncbi:hypothetical protein BCR37DRAFT_255022 [Protomyces lactucae-debilis]|uniref:Uncharacterized protein n=1 Tax=Protomyces lactucae-debilis TaxID=2754530 RepID=A0A1Y2FLS3_PROLT|nr:uncharacterized protein BCR37DRAFT_255022 [Protomyces lactucae-debilis]ORY84942.1 hypothetical protein BCR37DRAFT_255022 [Protomyces lactucae-debilis]